MDLFMELVRYYYNTLALKEYVAEITSIISYF